MIYDFTSNFNDFQFQTYERNHMLTIMVNWSIFYVEFVDPVPCTSLPLIGY